MPEETTKKNIPYGLWPSPISANMLSQGIRLYTPAWDSDGQTILWIEGRSGQYTLVAQRENDARRDLTTDHSLRGGAFYGGGEYTTKNGMVFFTNRDGRIYRKPIHNDFPKPITPPFGAAAAPAVSPNGKSLIYVYTDGKDDYLALVDTSGSQWPKKLVQGADFYMQPSWHPDGTKITWIEWDHPNMAWDGTRLFLADITEEDGPIQKTIHIAGDANTPVSQPVFSPDGQWLSYLINNGEWEDLVLYHLETGERRVLVHGDQFNLGQPVWVQGVCNYGWRYDSSRIYYTQIYGGKAAIWQVDIQTGETSQLDLGHYTWVDQLKVSPTTDEFLFEGSSPLHSPRIVRWQNNTLQTVAYSSTENIPDTFIPEIQPIQWQAPDGTTVHGLYYPPMHPTCTAEGLPPAIIRIHGGPTGSVNWAFNSETLYYTSRGYAVLEVNFRGSTTYGRSYQQALNKGWGVVDVEDAAGGAQALVDQKLANPKQLIIRGGSSGGYTVLNALIRYPGLFKAGICLYPVSNLFVLEMETHKFEASYNSKLIGTLPEAAQRFHDWSPIFHADQIRDALAIFQGGKDRVVLPAHTEELIGQLRKNRVPHIYKLFENEGHGFRKNETIAEYLKMTEKFLQENVLFAP